MSTHKRFPTVGGNGKVIDPVSTATPARKFGTVKAATPTVAPKRSTQPVASQRDYPFDLDGTERIVSVGATTVPMLRRPSAVITPVSKAKPTTKVKADKPVPAAKLKLPKALAPSKKVGEKPALAKRNAKVVPEVTAPILATKAEAKKIADVKKSVGPKAAKVIDAAVKEASAKPGKIADKQAHDKALKAGTLVKVEPKAKVTKKVTPIKPAKTVKAPVTKIENASAAGTKATKDTKVFNKSSTAKKAKK